MVKKETALNGVYLIRESMELMGGMGYIEDTIMPKLMRDTMVLPIWEGASNIMVLDMLRASFKSKGLDHMISHMSNSTGKHAELGQYAEELEALQKMAGKLSRQPQDMLETSALYFFRRLSSLYQKCLMAYYKDSSSEPWITSALAYFAKEQNRHKNNFTQAPDEKKSNGSWAGG